MNKEERNVVLSHLQTNKENPHQRSLFNYLVVERGRVMEKIMNWRSLKSQNHRLIESQIGLGWKRH